MPSEKSVLLARPHAFIVNEMGPFLREAGYTPVRVDTVEQLQQALKKSWRGAVVSTAVTSAMQADAGQVFGLIHEQLPQLPVVFAGMADVATITATARRAVGARLAAAEILTPEAARSSAAGQRGSRLLVLRKEDLTDAAARQAALRAVQALFG